MPQGLQVRLASRTAFFAWGLSAVITRTYATCFLPRRIAIAWSCRRECPENTSFMRLRSRGVRGTTARLSSAALCYVQVGALSPGVQDYRDAHSQRSSESGAAPPYSSRSSSSSGGGHEGSYADAALDRPATAPAHATRLNAPQQACIL